MPTKNTAKRKAALTDAPKPTETAPEEEQAPPESGRSAAASESGEPDFFEQLQAFTPDQWQSGLKIYVYRCWPIIDRREDNHFLAKIAEAFDEDYLLRHFGSGAYYLRLNDRRGKTLNSKTVSIHNRDHPPRVDLAEVVASDPRNERYFAAWPAGTQPSPAPADTAALHELSKLAAKVLDQRESVAPQDGEQANLTSTLVKWALDQTGKERESSDPTRIAALLKELKALLPQQQPAADGLALVDRVLAVVQKLNPAPPKPEAQDPLDYVDKVLNLADKLRPAQSAPALPTGDDGTMAAVSTIIHEIAVLLKDPLTIAMQAWALSKAQNAAGAAPALARSQPQPTPVLPAPAQPSGHAQPDAAQPDATAPPQPLPPQIIALASQVTPVMLKWLQADAPAAEQGAEFAAFVSDGWGFEDLKLLQDIGAAGIVDLYRRSPFWPILALMEGKFQEFVNAFVSWQPPKEESEDSAQQPESDQPSAEIVDLV